MKRKSELKNLNNYVRDDWFKTVDCITAFCDDEYEESMYINKIIDNFKERKPKYYRLLVSVMFADYYKLLYYRSRKQNICPTELEKLEFFDELDDLDDLLEKIEEDRSILDEITSQHFNYKEYDYFDKKKIISLNNSRNKYLLRICPTHILDLIEMAQNYSAEDLLCFYQDYLERFGADGYFDAIKSILTTMDVLYRYDIENYKDVLIDMIGVYYKWKKYLDNNSKNIILTPGEYRLIEMFEKQSMDIIFANSNKYPIILEEIVGGYLSFSNNQFQISNEEVDYYINNNVNKNIKEKLKLFKPKIKSL